MRQLLEDTEQQKEFKKAYETFNEQFWLPFSPKISEIVDTYSLRQEQFLPIFTFLRCHKFLIPILLEAPHYIRSFFGYKASLSLSLDRDPEGKFEELFVVTKSTQSAEEAITFLSKLDEAWFLRVLPKTRNRLNITVELQGE